MSLLEGTGHVSNCKSFFHKTEIDENKTYTDHNKAIILNT